jgi:hypothetical protein
MSELLYDITNDGFKVPRLGTCGGPIISPEIHFIIEHPQPEGELNYTWDEPNITHVDNKVTLNTPNAKYSFKDQMFANTTIDASNSQNITLDCTFNKSIVSILGSPTLDIINVARIIFPTSINYIDKVRNLDNANLSFNYGNNTTHSVIGDVYGNITNTNIVIENIGTSGAGIIRTLKSGSRITSGTFTYSKIPNVTLNIETGAESRGGTFTNLYITEMSGLISGGTFTNHLTGHTTPVTMTPGFARTIFGDFNGNGEISGGEFKSDGADRYTWFIKNGFDLTISGGYFECKDASDICFFGPGDRPNAKVTGGKFSFKAGLIVAFMDLYSNGVTGDIFESINADIPVYGGEFEFLMNAGSDVDLAKFNRTQKYPKENMIIKIWNASPGNQAGARWLAHMTDPLSLIRGGMYMAIAPTITLAAGATNPTITELGTPEIISNFKFTFQGTEYTASTTYKYTYNGAEFYRVVVPQ